MEAVLLKILNMSLSAALVIIVVLLARLLLRRAPGKWRYLLWIVVAFRLLCPVSVSAPFNMSIQQVNETIEAVMNAHPKVLKTPAPFVRAEKFGEKGMDYTVRAWCQNADYWDVYFDLTEQIKEAFDQAGIAVPCGKMAVEVQNVNS